MPALHVQYPSQNGGDIKPKNPMERNKIGTKIFGRRIDDNVRLSTQEWQLGLA